MQIYLPIAEMSANILLLLGLGGAVGFLSGMFGVGGGFLLTPLLIFYGVPPPVAVGTGLNQIIASSISGAIAHTRRGSVDFRMGFVLLAGGIVGSVFGILLFDYLQRLGQIDLFISLVYVVFLGVIGGLMMWESVNALRAERRGGRGRGGHHAWFHALPFKMRFRRSKLYISVIPPLLIGMLVGVLAAIMGVGGGFVMVPAMIYLLRMPTNVVVGTSLFQIIFITAFNSYMHAINHQAVDGVLALILIVGGVVGAEFGVRAGAKLIGAQLRALLALLVLLVSGRLAFDLFATPADLYDLTSAGLG
ncbi:MAG: sulfite exporter TauE/SafE family protein [Alphaproteobacteria bacterium]|nr:sulfite exporter TauE/SafE family protein [Alphaproteobacteria bacterium]